MQQNRELANVSVWFVHPSNVKKEKNKKVLWKGSSLKSMTHHFIILYSQKNTLEK